MTSVKDIVAGETATVAVRINEHVLGFGKKPYVVRAWNSARSSEVTVFSPLSCITTRCVALFLHPLITCFAILCATLL